MKKSKHPHPQSSGRRRLLGALTVGGGALAAKALPERWTRPVVDSVLLPAHAQTSPGSGPSGPRFRCRVQGPSAIPVGGTGTVLMTITPPPGTIPIQVAGDCNGAPAFGGTSNFNFPAPAGQAVANFPVSAVFCNPGDVLTVRLTAPTLGGINATCRFDVV